MSSQKTQYVKGRDGKFTGSVGQPAKPPSVKPNLKPAAELPHSGEDSRTGNAVDAVTQFRGLLSAPVGETTGKQVKRGKGNPSDALSVFPAGVVVSVLSNSDLTDAEWETVGLWISSSSWRDNNHDYYAGRARGVSWTVLTETLVDNETAPGSTLVGLWNRSKKTDRLEWGATFAGCERVPLSFALDVASDGHRSGFDACVTTHILSRSDVDVETVETLLEENRWGSRGFFDKDSESEPDVSLWVSQANGLLVLWADRFQIPVGQLPGNPNRGRGSTRVSDDDWADDDPRDVSDGYDSYGWDDYDSYDSSW